MNRNKTIKSFGFLLIVMVCFGFQNLFAGVMAFNRESTTPMASFNRVHIRGDYAYCAIGRGGLGIVDISKPQSPSWAGMFNTPGYAVDIYVQNNVAFVADNKQGLQVIDVSNPTAPKRISNYNYSTGNRALTRAVHVKKNFAYLACHGELVILDVSTPSAPSRAGSVDMSDYPGLRDVFVSGNYAYVIAVIYLVDDYMAHLFVFDVSNPRQPIQTGKFDFWGDYSQIEVKNNMAYLSGREDAYKLLVINVSNPAVPAQESYVTSFGRAYGLFLHNNHAYLGAGEDGLMIVDITDPSAPIDMGIIDTPGIALGGAGKDNYIYIADNHAGLQVFDASNPAAPVQGEHIDYIGGEDTYEVYVSGNYAFLSDSIARSYINSLKIFDVSNTAAPTFVTALEMRDFPDGVVVQGDYAYLANRDGGLKIIDMKKPAEAKIVGGFPSEDRTTTLAVWGNVAYLADRDGGVVIVDVSDPSEPVEISRVRSVRPYGLALGNNGNTLYVGDYHNGVKVIDVTDPAAPVVDDGLVLFISIFHLQVDGDFLYAASRESFKIFDISAPFSPRLLGTYQLDDIMDIRISGGYAFIATLWGVTVLDLSNPASPTAAGNLYTPQNQNGVFVKDNLIYLAEQEFSIFSYRLSDTRPQLAVNRSLLHFAYRQGDGATPPQPIRVLNSGGGSLSWKLSTSDSWISFSPGTGFAGEEVFISVNPSGMTPGTYTGSVEIAGQMAVNSPVYISVTLTVHQPGAGIAPFGVFAEPEDGAVVSGSIPLTGWALDDVGVQNVRFYMEEGNGLVHIDDALFVQGARPDVENAFPYHPNNHNAGWGYMLLTNYLPGGNGTFRIHAVATDTEGNETTLGIKTIRVDNANTVKPFGAIDTPEQGGMAAGSDYVNFGWVLTPQPNTIPTGGSTIRVWIDGVPVGNPVYNQYRADIASLFPGYNNSGGAVGYFYIDTTGYADGLHTIQWTATDDAGNTDGIGSRFFSIWNGNSSENARDSRTTDHLTGIINHTRHSANPSDIPLNRECSLLEARTGFDVEAPVRAVTADEPGTFRVTARRLGRVEITFPGLAGGKIIDGFHQVGRKIYTLPPGSTLDKEKGVFYWQPGPGFSGNYHFVFVCSNNNGERERINIIVTVTPGGIK